VITPNAMRRRVDTLARRADLGHQGKAASSQEQQVVPNVFLKQDRALLQRLHLLLSMSLVNLCAIPALPGAFTASAESRHSQEPAQPRAGTATSRHSHEPAQPGAGTAPKAVAKPAEQGQGAAPLRKAPLAQVDSDAESATGTSTNVQKVARLDVCLVVCCCLSGKPVSGLYDLTTLGLCMACV
jgi:hypothetical protein